MFNIMTTNALDDVGDVNALHGLPTGPCADGEGGEVQIPLWGEIEPIEPTPAMQELLTRMDPRYRANLFHFLGDAVFYLINDSDPRQRVHAETFLRTLEMALPEEDRAAFLKELGLSEDPALLIAPAADFDPHKICRIIKGQF